MLSVACGHSRGREWDELPPPARASRAGSSKHMAEPVAEGERLDQWDGFDLTIRIEPPVRPVMKESPNHAGCAPAFAGRVVQTLAVWSSEAVTTRWPSGLDSALFRKAHVLGEWPGACRFGRPTLLWYPGNRIALCILKRPVPCPCLFPFFFYSRFGWC